MFLITVFVQWAVGNCVKGNYHVTGGFLNAGLALSAQKAVSLVTGQTYCVTIKAYNYAGIFNTSSPEALKTSPPVLIDDSPPVAGWVNDGLDVEISHRHYSSNDLDYQSSNEVVQAHWHSWVDITSGIYGYRCAVGSAPLSDDVVSWFFVGTATTCEASIADQQFEQWTVLFVSVEAINFAGLSTTISSDGVMLEDTAPQSGVVFEAPYQISTSELAVRWEQFADEQSAGVLEGAGVQHFLWGIGTSADGSTQDVLPLTNVGLSVRARSTDLQLVCGSVYYVTVVCVDNAGTETHQTTGGITVDCTAPVSIAPADINIDVAHGPGPKISWTPFVDFESEIHFYKVSLGTSTGAGQAQRTTHTGTATEFVVTQPVMEFQDGRDYFATVVAQNRAGRQTIVCSNAFRLDRTPPRPGNVVVTDPWRLDDSRYNPTGLESMVLAWDSFVDVHSSIVRYEIAVGTSAGSDDAHAFEDVGLQAAATAAPLTMTGGLVYYASVKAVDAHGNFMIASSDPIIVDGSAPSATSGFIEVHTTRTAGSRVTLGRPRTPDESGTVYLQSFSGLRLSWGAFIDEESSIAAYSVAVGFDDCGSEDIVAMQSVGLSKTWTLEASNLEGELQQQPAITIDSVVVASVWAINRTGLSAELCSPVIKIDESGPDMGTVFDGDHTRYVNSCRGSCKEIDYQPSDSRIDAHWAGFADDESGIVKYEWAVGSGPRPSQQVMAFEDVGTATSASCTTDKCLHLENVVTYYVTVRAWNGAGRYVDASEKYAKLAQKFGQLQPFLAVFPLQCMGQVAYFVPT